MASSIPTARANLHTALVAKTSVSEHALEGVQVTFGPPEAHTEERVVVAILGVTSITTDFAAIGAQRKNESYAINMRIKVWDPGAGEQDLATIDARAWALYDAVRAVVAEDITLDGALTSGWAIVATAGDDTEESPLPVADEYGGGWVEFVDLRVVCTARIT